MMKHLAIVALAATMAGCAGDYRKGSPSEPTTPPPADNGGDDSGAPPPEGSAEVDFTSFSAASGASAVRFSGIASESTYTRSRVGSDEDGWTNAVTFVSDPLGTGAATVRVGYAANGDAKSIDLYGTHTQESWDSVTNGQYADRASADGSVVRIAEPSGPGLDFEYQTFGIWHTGAEPQTGGRIGAFSVGAATAAADVPSTGSATFVGRSQGVYVDGTGKMLHSDADSRLDVDFAGGAATFRTTGTLLTGTDGSGVAAAPELDIAGTLSRSGAGFSGAVSSAGMSGTAEGAFYGPGAAEAGGLFSLKGSGTESHIGSFGGRR